MRRFAHSERSTLTSHVDRTLTTFLHLVITWQLDVWCRSKLSVPSPAIRMLIQSQDIISFGFDYVRGQELAMADRIFG